MPNAEIIAIGTELLLGEIQDTNTKELARFLRGAGIDLYRATMIGDNPERIAQSIRESLSRADIIITTGGLGPTVDDPTRDAIALAVGVKTVFVPELWEQVQARFQRFGRIATENNKKQAYIPSGAIPVENQVGTAPAFIVEIEEKTIISLPGVPKEMEYLLTQKVLPFLQQKYSLKDVIKTHVLHTAGVGESQVDEWVGLFEASSNPTVGLSAHPGQTDLRITAKAPSEIEVDQMIREVSEKLILLLGDSYYGADSTTLEMVVSQLLKDRVKEIVILECGLDGELIKRISPIGVPPSNLVMIESFQGVLENTLSDRINNLGTGFGLAVSLIRHADKQELNIIILDHTNKAQTTRYYGGPPQNGSIWAANTAIDFLRRFLSSKNI